MISICNGTESSTIIEEIQTSKFKAKKSNKPVGRVLIFALNLRVWIYSVIVREAVAYKVIIPLKFPNTFQTLYFAFMKIDSMFRINCVGAYKVGISTSCWASNNYLLNLFGLIEQITD